MENQHHYGPAVPGAAASPTQQPSQPIQYAQPPTSTPSPHPDVKGYYGGSPQPDSQNQFSPQVDVNAAGAAAPQFGGQALPGTVPAVGMMATNPRNLQGTSQPVYCPRCSRVQLSEVHFEFGNFTHLIALLLYFVTLCLCWIPYIVRGMQDVVHKCPACATTFATFHRSGHTEVHIPELTPGLPMPLYQQPMYNPQQQMSMPQPVTKPETAQSMPGQMPYQGQPQMQHQMQQMPQMQPQMQQQMQQPQQTYQQQPV